MFLVSLVQPCTSRFVVHRYLVCIFFFSFSIALALKKEINNTCLCGDNLIYLIVSLELRTVANAEP